MNINAKDLLREVREQEKAFRSRIWLEYQYLTLHKSIYKIALEYRYDPATIHKWLKRFQIPIRGYSEAARLNSNHVDLTFEATEFMTGLLLGDGHLSQHKWSSTYCESSKSEGYLEWTSKELTNFGIEQSGRIKRQEKDTHFPDNKVCHTVTFHYNSRCYIELKDLWRKWYRPATEEELKVRPWKFIKIIPRDLKLTPLTCRQWYIGDGWLTHNAKSKYVSFATNGFTSSEVCFLVNLLRREGFKATRYVDNSIHTSTKSAESLLNYIGPCPEEIKSIYGYKW